MTKVIKLLALVAALSTVAGCKHLPPPAQLDCQARVLRPYITEDSEHFRLVRELVEMTSTGDLDLEQVLLDVGLLPEEYEEVKQAYKSCEPK
jgi:hypothetical protein